MVEIVAPKVGGVDRQRRQRHPAKQKVDGGPSVLYDAVALVVSEEGAALLAGTAAARDFVADAFAHAKFIAYVAAAQPLLDKAGVKPDAGFVALDAGGAADFVAACRKLRFWDREPGTRPAEAGRSGGGLAPPSRWINHHESVCFQSDTGNFARAMRLQGPVLGL